MNKNVNEEIKRIKSLFSNERLYGNLIKETSTEGKNPDINSDKVIDVTEFGDSNNEITRIEAELFLHNTDEPKANLVNYCLRDGSPLKKIMSTVIKKTGTITNKVNSSSTSCYWEVRRQPKAESEPKVSMTYFLEDFRLGFFVALEPIINMSTPAEASETLERTHWTTEFKVIVEANKLANRVKKVKLMKFVGTMIPSEWAANGEYENLTYKNLKFDAFYDEDMKKLSKGETKELFDTIESGGYQPYVTGSSPLRRNPAYGTTVDGILNFLGITPDTGKMKNIIDNLISS